jgi:hypothetical protein
MSDKIQPEQPVRMNDQLAPYPQELADLVSNCKLNPGWQVYLDDMVRDVGCSGLTLVIRVQGYDSYHPERGQLYRVHHYFPVPPATYDRRSWQAWLFKRYQDVVSHEACEFFQIDNERPYAPSHGPGNDPYLIREVGTDEDRRTSFRGVLK